MPIEKLVLFEPPVRDEGASPETAFTAEIAALVAAGDRAAAADRFLTAIGVPPEVIEGMAPVRPAFEAVAHTLVYDCVISDATDFDLLRSVRTPTLVLDSQGSSDDLTGGAAAIAGALPDGTLRTLTGGWHGVPDEDLAPVVIGFLRGLRAGQDPGPRAASRRPSGSARRACLPRRPDPGRGARPRATSATRR